MDSRVVSLEIAGIVVSLEISREILFVLRQKYTWTSLRFFLDFSVFFLGGEKSIFYDFVYDEQIDFLR